MVRFSRWWLMGVAGLATAALVAGCETDSVGPSQGTCSVGALGCACTAGGGCDPGLECISGTCLTPGSTPGAGGAGSTGTGSGDAASGQTGSGATDTGGTGSGGTGSGGTGSGGTTPEDPCTAGHGTTNSKGACIKGCQYDKQSAGHDLFGDCTDLHMLCTEEDYCAPDDFCKDDADCGDGYACAFFTYWGASCCPKCSTSSDCVSGTTCQTSQKDSLYDLALQKVCHKK